jgi:hypothetical protein
MVSCFLYYKVLLKSKLNEIKFTGMYFIAVFAVKVGKSGPTFPRPQAQACQACS